MMDAEIRYDIERCAEYASGSREYIDAAGRVRAWLAAQPAQWTPVEDGAHETEHIGEEIHTNRGWLFMAGPDMGLIGMLLPDNLRLCRLEP
jgi:hypothetical protein